MIYDNINNCQLYDKLCPAMRRVFQFLGSLSGSNITTGKHEIDGENIYAIISGGESEGKSGEMEAHRKYIDIHYVISGQDKVGYKKLDKCKQSGGEYNAEGDYILFREIPDFYVDLEEGDFVIFYPSDVHIPLQFKGKYKKAVVKVKI